VDGDRPVKVPSFASKKEKPRALTGKRGFFVKIGAENRY
jgi:hypothetical protein